MFLHAREPNPAALTLYRDTLKFKQSDIELQNYADEENAYAMVCWLKQTFEAIQNCFLYESLSSRPEIQVI